MSSRWDAIVAAVSKTFVPKNTGQQDQPRYSMDRSLRLIRCIDKLAATLPEELAPKNMELCHFAALFSPVNPLANPTDAEEAAADFLAPHIQENEIDVVMSILREHRTRNAKMTEARLLADAVALEDFGMVGFWNQCRISQGTSKGLEQCIKMFKTQQDYGYWTSRLRDGFYYPASRRTATERLALAAAMFQTLQQQHMAEDIR